MDIFLLYAHKLTFWGVYGCPKYDTWKGELHNAIPCPAHAMCSQLANSQLNRNYPMCAPDNRYDMTQSETQHPVQAFNKHSSQWAKPYTAEERSRLSEAYGETGLGFPKYLTRKRRAHLDSAEGQSAPAMGQEAMGSPEVDTKAIVFDSNGIPSVEPSSSLRR